MIAILIKFFQNGFRSFATPTARNFLSLWLPTLVFAASVPRLYAASHPPLVSWIESQAINVDNAAFHTVYMTTWDAETTLTKSNIVPEVQNLEGTNFYSSNKIKISKCGPSDVGCAQDTGYKLEFQPPANGDGAATVKIKVTDGDGIESVSSFTLRRQLVAKNVPLVAGIPNETVQVNGGGYGPVQFVVDDLDMSGNNDAEAPGGVSTIQIINKVSDNQFVVQNDGIQITDLGPRTKVLQVAPSGAGRAVITLTAVDNTGFKTDTSFVVNIVDTGTPPVFTQSATWAEHKTTDSTAYTDYTFNVTDAETLTSQLLLTAVSANSTLVPNDGSHLQLTNLSLNGDWRLRVTPQPLPGLGAPQATTITVSATDTTPSGSSFKAAYTKRIQFLFVTRDPNSTVPMFLRPTGIFNLNPDPVDHLDKPYITGEMHGITWRDLETGDNMFNWPPLDAFFAQLAPGQVLSLNLQEEPCYIAQHAVLATWCDTNADPVKWGCNTCGTGVSRAVPWDPYLWGRRERFLQKLADHLSSTGNLNKVAIINPNLPGGTTGIREMLGGPLNATDIPGYTRENFLAAVQHELRTVQDKFPGKHVQIGYFLVDDNLGGDPLWKWLYPYLANEFNGITRPRVSFFQEDLASDRPSATPDFIPYTNPPVTLAYTLYPDISQLPSFQFYCGPTGCNYTSATYNNGIVYQANTGWSAPLTNIDKTTKTLNSTPNDALEGAFNSFFNQYLEVYPGDLAHANTAATAPPWDAQRWQDGLQSWKDYTEHLRKEVLQLEAPANLTVARTAPGINTLSFAVYSPPDNPAVSYHVQRQTGVSWVDVCNPTTNTQCVDNSATGTSFLYQVWATNGVNPESPKSYIGLFLSQGTLSADNDGYVSRLDLTRTAKPADPEPGIRAGEGTGVGTQIPHFRGFLSFNTTSLGNGTILAAELRLRQQTPGSHFSELGACMVDIQKGKFHGNAALEGADYGYSDAGTTLNAFQVTDIGAGNWFEADLTPVKSTLSNNDYTQMRILFQETSISNRYEGWYSGNSAGNEPQLIIRYQP